LQRWRASLIHNEQTKLTVTALNNVAVAFVIAGFVGPMVAVGYVSGCETSLA
jgi:hypothetical protein